MTTLNDASLLPPPLNTAPGDEYHQRHRRFQGIPGIERTPRGRLFATWYTGGTGEGPDNHTVLVKSDDDGQTWTQPILAIDPPGKVRSFDPVLWLDPGGTLWLFWGQSYEWYDGRAGVWTTTCTNPDAPTLQWSQPRWLFDGIMMNKPTVLTDGTWLMPACLWNFTHKSVNIVRIDALQHLQFSSVYASTDAGRTFTLRGSADVPERTHDEHMVLQQRDGSLRMLVRTGYGIGESLSRDGGVTWSPGKDSGIKGPNSRFHIRRLRSGRVLLVNHHNFTERDHLTALLSEDDGQTWPHTLLLDERARVSYPDACESVEGRIDITYDRNRHADQEILHAVIAEEDILAGRLVSAGSRLKNIISRASE